MFELLKYLPLVARFKDVSDEVKRAGLEKRPWYLQRTFFGAFMTLVGAFAAIQFGVQVSADDLSITADNLTQLAALIATAYGAILSLYGIVMKAIKAKQSVQSGNIRLGLIPVISLVTLSFALSACAAIQDRAAAQRYIDAMVFKTTDCESGYASLYPSGPPACMSIDDVQKLRAEGYL